MKKFKIFIALTTIATTAIVLSTSCESTSKDVLFACDTANVSYSKTIKPMLDNRCNNCHSTASAATIGGGTILDDTTEIKNWTDTTGGYPGLWVVCSNDYSSVGGYRNRMPKDAAVLSDCEVLKIKTWIFQGTNFNN